MRGLLSILAAGILAAGCTAAGNTGSGGPAGTTSPSPATGYSWDHSPGALVLRADTGGGLVPIEFFLNHVPQFSLYGDGSIVTPGPVDYADPAPLLPNLRVRHVGEADVRAILAAAGAAGLLGPDASYSIGGIMDAPTTTFTAVVDGGRHVVRAYALGIDGPTHADPAIAAARARLAAFMAVLADPGAFLGRDLGPGQAYEPASMRIFTTPYDPAVDTVALKRGVVEWPLAADPGTAGEPARNGTSRCIVASGAELATFTAVAAGANGLTLWRAGSRSYTVIVRPNLPDESGCGAAV